MTKRAPKTERGAGCQPAKNQADWQSAPHWHAAFFLKWAMLCLCLIVAQAAFGQGVSGLYRITDGVSGSHVEYHAVEIPQGKEISLAQLQGPGKVSYFYITDDSQGKFC